MSWHLVSMLTISAILVIIFLFGVYIAMVSYRASNISEGMIGMVLSLYSGIALAGMWIIYGFILLALVALQHV